MVKFNILFSGLLAATACAHPGEHHSPEEVAAGISKRDTHAAHIARGLSKCIGKPSYERLMRGANTRLTKKAAELRNEFGISHSLPYKTRRDLAELEAYEEDSHDYSSKGFTKSTKPKKLFAQYKNSSCVLTPEVTEGPYWVTGEYVRKNVVRGQSGIPVHLEYQFIDTSTCNAVSGMYVETWQANATGVYSGIVANGNGVGTDDPGNLNTTFLRGAQMTNSQGVVSFNTIFVGHYAGRASHIHMIAMQDGTLESNNTYQSGTITHVGQLFFDESLKDAVEATSPYNTNTQAITTNDEDMWAPAQASAKYDPIPDYAWLGSDITDGLLMWISVGIDTSADYTVSAAGAWTANGGVASSSTNLEGSGSSMNGTTPTVSTAAGSGSITTPTGGMPTGSMGGGGSGVAPTSTA